MNFLKKHFAIIIIISLSILIIGLTIYTYWKNDFLNPNYFLGTDKLGDFGSFIGGFLGTLITLIATVYVYKTYRSQKKELKKQKKQLKLQSQLIAQQQFESTFFNMLNVHRELKNNLKLNQINYLFQEIAKYGEHKNNVEVISKISTDFKLFYNTDFTFHTLINHDKLNPQIKKTLKEEYEKNGNIFEELNDLENPHQPIINIDKNNNSIKYQENKIKFFFRYMFENYQNQISHYCSNVYNILKFIRENEENKTLGNDFNKYKSYADIFQSQLNKDEQFLLFYNFIYFNENDNEKYLNPIEIVNHYEFLENLGSNNLLDKDLHNNKKFYSFNIK